MDEFEYRDKSESIALLFFRPFGLSGFQLECRENVDLFSAPNKSLSFFRIFRRKIEEEQFFFIYVGERLAFEKLFSSLSSNHEFFRKNLRESKRVSEKIRAKADTGIRTLHISDN